MLKAEYPEIELNSFKNLEIKTSEPKTKINVRGKSKDFFTKVEKILSIILPTEANTSSSNEKFNVLWLSPDEWMIYFVENNKENIFENLFDEISKLNFAAITDVSNQWICINLKGKNVFDLLSAGSPFNFNEFRNNKNEVAQTLLNNIDVTLHHKEINEINLFVRRSFSEHLFSWMNDAARFI